jgi:hypothetical protein
MTEPDKYNVILSPQIRMGHDLDMVVQSFADLFKISTEKAGRIVGTRRVLKKEVPLPKAKYYQHKLEAIGLNVLLEKVTGVNVSAAPAQMKKPQPVSPNKSTLELVPTEAELAAEAADPESGSADLIICPKCQLQQPRAAECIGCGVIIHKVTGENPPVKPAEPAPQKIQTKRAEATAAVASAESADTGSSRLVMFLAPVVVALLGALLWKFIAVTFNYELGLIAWLVGGAIGFSAAVAGAKGQSAAVACAVLALLAILGGKYMAASSFISEATASVAAGGEFEGMNLRTVYDELRVDAARFSEAVTDERSLREFLVERGYSEAGDAPSVTDEEIQSFKEFVQPRLETMLSNPQSYEEWKNDTLASDLEDISVVGVIIEDLGVIDFLFLFLGVGTAYRLGMGTEA